MPESSESEVLGVETSCLYPHQDRLPQAAITCEIVLERTLCELVATAPHYNLCVSWSLCELVAAAPHSNFCVSWSQPSIITVDCLCELVAAPVVPAPHDRVSVDRVSSKRHFSGSSWHDRVYSFSKMSFPRGRGGHFRSHSNPIKHLPPPHTPLMIDAMTSHPITIKR